MLVLRTFDVLFLELVSRLRVKVGAVVPIRYSAAGAGSELKAGLHSLSQVEVGKAKYETLAGNVMQASCRNHNEPDVHWSSR
jgi:hypothetical protein